MTTFILDRSGSLDYADNRDCIEMHECCVCEFQKPVSEIGFVGHVPVCNACRPRALTCVDCGCELKPHQIADGRCAEHYTVEDAA